MGILAGKKGLLVGIANAHSIAYGCAEVIRELAGSLAVTYLNDKAEHFVRPLAEQLQADMKSPEVEEHIATSMRLADALGFNGTLAFVIGDQLIPGFVERDQLTEAVAAARSRE